MMAGRFPVMNHMWLCIAVSRLEVLLVVGSYDFKFKLWILGSEKADDLDTTSSVALER